MGSSSAVHDDTVKTSEIPDNVAKKNLPRQPLIPNIQDAQKNPPTEYSDDGTGGKVPWEVIAATIMSGLVISGMYYARQIWE